MDQIEVHLARSYRIMMVLLGPFTLGTATLALWIAARSWPRVIDREGITTRGGKRYLWSQLTDMVRVTVNSGGQRISGRLDLKFGKAKVPVVPQSLAEGQAVMDYLSRLFGEPVTTG